MVGNHAAENRAIALVLWSSWDTGTDQSSQVNGEEEESAMMFFAVFPSEISNSC